MRAAGRAGARTLRTARSSLAALGLALVPSLIGSCGRGAGEVAGDRTATPRRAAGPVLAAPTLRERACIERLAQAERTIVSTGWKTLVQGPPGASRETRLRVSRFADGRTDLSWDGAGDRAPLRWEARGRAPWASRVELVLRNYAVVDDGTGPTVAWRATERVRFVPRREDRPSLELLADAETGLVLAETHRSAAGEEVFVSRYESIEFGTPPEPTAEGERVGDHRGVGDDGEELDATLRETGRAASLPWTPLRVATLPEGFVPVTEGPGTSGGPGAGVAGVAAVHREDFTDGVAVLSVVQRLARTSGPPTAETPREGECRRRAWRGGSSLEGVLGGVEVRVSGTLPPSVLQTVLAGLERPATPAR